MSSTNSVAVLVLTHNHEKFIRSCIDSILRSSLKHFHVWILDDGSTDRTLEILTEISERTQNITLIRQSHIEDMPSKLSQRLVEVSNGEYLVLMSGDDMIGPADGLQRAIDVMEKNPRLDAVIPRMVYLMDDPACAAPQCHSPSLLVALRSGSAVQILQDHLYQNVSRIFLQGMALRRSAVTAFGGFDTSLQADDYAFVMRMFHYLHEKDRKFLFDEQSVWLYRVHDTNAHRNSVRQFSVVAEVVAKYIAPSYRCKFVWDAMIFNELSEFRAMHSKARRLFDRSLARKSLTASLRASFRIAAKQGNLTLLAKSFLYKDLTVPQRIAAFSWLLKGAIMRLISGGRWLCR